MFEKEKNLDVSAWGYSEPVVLKRLTAGEKKLLDDELARANGFKVKNKDTTGDIRPGSTTLLSACAYIKTAPFPSNLPSLERLDWELIEYIAEEGSKLNSPFVVRRESASSSGSGEPSAAEVHPTQIS